VKLDDLRKSFEKIDAAPRCLGSTMFLWGSWTQQKPTYFSAFLAPNGTDKKVADRDLYITPMAEEFCHYWSGKYPESRGPVLTNITITGKSGATKTDAIVRTDSKFKVTAAAATPNARAAKLAYRWWILDQAGAAVSGPVNTDKPAAELKAPGEAGSNYVVMVFVIEENKLASGFTVPLKVESAESAGLR
jgi:hypothetical protein